MCGIIGVFHTGDKPEPVNQIVLAQFEDQKSRGMNGFGIIKINAKNKFKVDRATEGYKFIHDMYEDPVTKMIVHHRTPTSTDNLMAQTHPIWVNNGSLAYDYLIVHNGIIQNDDELKKIHEALGFAYNTEMKNSNKVTKFNDSEALAIELARYIEKQSSIMDLKGSAAFIAIQIEKKTQKVDKMYFGRTGYSPLKMAKTRGKLFLSSEGQGADITEDILYSCKLDEIMALTKQRLVVAKKDETDFVNVGRKCTEKECNKLSYTKNGVCWAHDPENDYHGNDYPGETRTWPVSTNKASTAVLKNSSYEDDENNIEPIKKENETQELLPGPKDIGICETVEEEQFQESMEIYREEIDALADEFLVALCESEDPQGIDTASYAYEMQELLARARDAATKARTQIQLAEEVSDQGILNPF